MRKTNIVRARFTQTVVSKKKQKDGTFADFIFEASPVEVSNETVQDITASEVAIWLMGQLKKVTSIARLQGKKGFMLSKPIDLHLSINEKTERMDFRFSLSTDRILGLVEKHPLLVATVFMPTAHIKNKVAGIAYLTDGAESIVAKAIKKLEKGEDIAVETKELQEKQPKTMGEIADNVLQNMLPAAMTEQVEGTENVDVQDEKQAIDNQPYVFASTETENK